MQITEIMKAYVGTAKKVPDSLTPRRFMAVRIAMTTAAATPSCPARPGIIASAF